MRDLYHQQYISLPQPRSKHPNGAMVAIVVPVFGLSSITFRIHQKGTAVETRGRALDSDATNQSN